MTKHQEIISLLPVILDTPITVNNNVRIYDIETGDGGIWVRTGDGAWHDLEEKDRNYESVADAILKRLYASK